MAISGSDGSIILTTQVDQSGLKKGLGSMKKLGATAGKAFLAIGAAAATATVAITKMATSAYADYEQLVGGVETLFKGSADKVKAYAENAFYTAGVSANEYMKQVTSFSASLIRSTAGDTDKAADIANMALIDISDSVNKMGSSMESVTLAYQGFAKQQYMLLDNLKLGYGGTKTEMERLLKDAQALTGVKYDINNLADGYSAIQAIQEELGITGSSAKEAEKTITGSANMMKAAWQNVLSAIAGGGDLDRAINNLVFSIQKYFENIVPVVERSLQGIGQLIERVAPMLVQTVARSLIKAIPSLLNAVYQMIIGLARGIYEGIIALFSGGTQKVVEAQTNQIAQSVENQNALTEAVEETEKAQKGALAGFDEINILAKDTAETQMGNLSGSSVGGIVSNDDVNATKKANKEYGVFNKIIDNLVKALKPLKNISFDNLSQSFKNLSVSLEPYKNLVLEGLRWLWFDVLVPMSEWTIENLIPAFLDTLSAALEFLTPILEAIQPTLSWLWDEILVPMASFVGDLFLDFLNLLTDAFTKLSDWAKEHPEEIQYMADVFLGFLAGIWIYNTSKKIIDFLGKLITKFKEFGGLKGLMENLGKAINSPALAIGLLVDAGLFWVKNWDKIKSAFEGMSGWQKTIIVVLGLAAAIAVLWTALSVGVAAAGIVAGLAALGLGAGILAIGNANEKAKPSKNLKSIPSDSVVANSVPTKSIGNYSIPKLAQGAVIPPNREFLAVLGDNKNGRNLEAPESLLREIYAEGNAETNALLQQLIQVMQKGMTVNVDGKQLMRINREAETRVGRQTVTGGFANAY